MSTSDQKDIDALLAQVQTDAAAVSANAQSAPDAANAALDQAAAAINEIAGEMEPPASAPRTRTQDQLPVDAADMAPPGSVEALPASAPSSDVNRLLAIEVPVIVQLGMRRLTVGEVMRLAVGAIVEFGKSAEEELDLLVNNKAVGKGHAVKVGENFGIKVTTIGTAKEIIRKLGQ